MRSGQENIEPLLPGYFQGTLSVEEREEVECWRQHSEANNQLFSQSEKVWRSLILLSEMERYNTPKALQRFHQMIIRSKNQRWWVLWQRIAAIVVLPLVITAVWLWLAGPGEAGPPAMVWHSYSTPPGVKAQFYLPDSTLVWLNSSSSIRYPSDFDGHVRHVTATGELCFDVRHREKQPFVLTLGKIHVRVLGTTFNVVHYENENSTEVVLQEGKVELCTGSLSGLVPHSSLEPGEMALYNKLENTLNLRKVETGKYLSWITGKLVFKDDTMEEVVRRLNRWFNVNIEVADPEILGYVYTATFQDETLDQILELLAISAPIRYQVVPREKQGNGFSAKRIILRKAARR